MYGYCSYSIFFTVYFWGISFCCRCFAIESKISANTCPSIFSFNLTLFNFYLKNSNLYPNRMINPMNIKSFEEPIVQIAFISKANKLFCLLFRMNHLPYNCTLFLFIWIFFITSLFSSTYYNTFDMIHLMRKNIMSL